MKDFLSAAKAAADENRARILLFLGRGELCVCHIVAMLGLAPSTVSKHLSLLSQAGLIESRKDGRWMHYRLAGRGASVTARGTLRWLRAALADNPVVRRDAERLGKVRRMSARRLCACYRER